MSLMDFIEAKMAVDWMMRFRMFKLQKLCFEGFQVGLYRLDNAVLYEWNVYSEAEAK